MTVYATIDLGGTKIAGALATVDGAIVAERTVPTHSYAGPRAVVERIGALVNELATECGERPAALGLGIPGNANGAGEVIFLPNLAGNWRNVPARAHVPRRRCAHRALAAGHTCRHAGRRCPRGAARYQLGAPETLK